MIYLISTRTNAGEWERATQTVLEPAALVAKDWAEQVH